MPIVDKDKHSFKQPDQLIKLTIETQADQFDGDAEKDVHQFITEMNQDDDLQKYHLETEDVFKSNAIHIYYEDSTTVIERLKSFFASNNHIHNDIEALTDGLGGLEILYVKTEDLTVSLKNITNQIISGDSESNESNTNDSAVDIFSNDSPHYSSDGEQDTEENNDDTSNEAVDIFSKDKQQTLFDAPDDENSDEDELEDDSFKEDTSFDYDASHLTEQQQKDRSILNEIIPDTDTIKQQLNGELLSPEDRLEYAGKNIDDDGKGLMLESMVKTRIGSKYDSKYDEFKSILSEDQMNKMQAALDQFKDDVAKGKYRSDEINQYLNLIQQRNDIRDDIDAYDASLKERRKAQKEEAIQQEIERFIEQIEVAYDEENPDTTEEEKQRYMDAKAPELQKIQDELQSVYSKAEHDLLKGIESSTHNDAVVAAISFVSLKNQIVNDYKEMVDQLREKADPFAGVDLDEAVGDIYDPSEDDDMETDVYQAPPGVDPETGEISDEYDQQQNTAAPQDDLAFGLTDTDDENVNTQPSNDEPSNTDAFEEDDDDPFMEPPSTADEWDDDDDDDEYEVSNQIDDALQDTSTDLDDISNQQNNAVDTSRGDTINDPATQSNVDDTSETLMDKIRALPKWVIITSISAAVFILLAIIITITLLVTTSGEAPQEEEEETPTEETENYTDAVEVGDPLEVSFQGQQFMTTVDELSPDGGIYVTPNTSIDGVDRIFLNPEDVNAYFGNGEENELEDGNVIPETNEENEETSENDPMEQSSGENEDGEQTPETLPSDETDESDQE